MNSAVDLRLPFSTRPLSANLGAEISGVTLAGDLSDDVFDAIYQAFLRYQVLLFPPQELPPDRQVSLARRFGEVQIHVMNQYHADGHPELYRLSNLDDQGRPNGKHPDKGTLYWHTDGSWRRVTGQATIIYGEVVPEIGGETHFSDMYGAYARLDPAWKARIANLRAMHNLDFSRTRRHGVDLMTDVQRKDSPPVEHPVVRIGRDGLGGVPLGLLRVGAHASAAGQYRQRLGPDLVQTEPLGAGDGGPGVRITGVQFPAAGVARGELELQDGHGTERTHLLGGAPRLGQPRHSGVIK